MEMILLALAAIMLLNQKQPEKKQSNLFEGINDLGIFGDGAKNLMDSFSKLNKDGDKTSAIMELISNPLVFNMLKNTLFKDKAKENEKPPAPEQNAQNQDNIHTEKYETDNNFGKTENVSADKNDKDLEKTIKEAKENYEKKGRGKNFSDTEETEDVSIDGEPFSAEAKDFFRPVEKIAGLEVSRELYKLYDGWYLNE